MNFEFSLWGSDRKFATPSAGCPERGREKEGIKIAGECVGGSMGRSVEFSVETGIVTVKTIF